MSLSTSYKHWLRCIAPHLKIKKNARALSGSNRLDCSGMDLQCSAGVFDYVDEAIHNLITLDGHSHNLVKQALDQDSACPMVLIVAVLEVEKRGKIEGIDLHKLFRQLNQMNARGKMTARESLLACGAYAVHQQRYFEAGTLFESILKQQPQDILALRLSSEAYLKAGSGHHSLGSALKYRGAQSALTSLQPTVQGLIAMGYAETNRHLEAEEIAQRAVGMSRFKDSCAVSALLSSHYFRGKSSEAIALLDEHKSSSSAFRYGEQLWQFHLGMAYVMRGNCNGAFKVMLHSLERYEQEREKIPMQITLGQSFLLWQILLHIGPHHILPVDLICKYLATGLESIREESMAYMWVKTLLLAARYMSVQGDNVEQLMRYRKLKAMSEGSEKTEEEGFKLSSLFLSPVKKSEEEEERMKTYMQSKEQLLYNVRVELYHWLDQLNSYPSIKDEQLLVSLSSRPSLPYLSPPHSLHEQNRKVKEACKAILQYSLGEYDQVCYALKGGYYPLYEGIGLNVVQRDILANTFLAAIMKKGDHAAAERFLIERVYLYPNNGQTWKKLSEIYQQLGKKELAQEAEYTSWQLGIAQGGFGGAI